MKRIGILTAGGDTPALNATLFGAVERANELGIEVLGFIRGFDSLLDPCLPHVRLNPLYSTIPELEPTQGGTILGSSRTYVDQSQSESLKTISGRLERMGVEGLVCIGGDGTLSALQSISEFLPCVLAPKTIDNDLGLNYLDEPNEWQAPDADHAEPWKKGGRADIDLEEIINYATPGYATAVFVVAQSIQRIRTTAESHRRIAIVEVMGRDSGYIALGAAYGQPDLILIPELPLDYRELEDHVRELYDLQQHAVIVVGEGVIDKEGRRLGDISKTIDPAGNIVFSGAADEIKKTLMKDLGDEYFRGHRSHETVNSAFFTRKVGHTQRGGPPIKFDRFFATQLGGKAVEMIDHGENNCVATLQWSKSGGFQLDSLPANKLRDRFGKIRARQVHPSFFDSHRLQPSRLGIEYLLPIFTNAIGESDLEHFRLELFDSGNLTSRYQSTNVDIQKRVKMAVDK